MLEKQRRKILRKFEKVISQQKADHDMAINKTKQRQKDDEKTASYNSIGLKNINKMNPTMNRERGEVTYLHRKGKQPLRKFRISFTA